MFSTEEFPPYKEPNGSKESATTEDHGIEQQPAKPQEEEKLNVRAAHLRIFNAAANIAQEEDLINMEESTPRDVAAVLSPISFNARSSSLPTATEAVTMSSTIQDEEFEMRK